ncbi:DUF4331 domain-containing protein [Cryptosporangium aurantiacum]|uniref:DUF4331 domain-containing protein n=1 Tax=Cryptosporangium aurantiacum TaxID=134849 RepID=A0A1M7GZJ1_9ACTN|nr:DUF4331 domain-containing protein [Cryptosporangium aurantiacum]SHM21299.1 protein of unknown function [Cryptosporangium aurantiacum]
MLLHLPGRSASGSRARRRAVRAAAAVAAAAALTALGLPALAPGGATASSHREAPTISGFPQYDDTDVYAFVSPDKPDSVTLIANWIPFEEPAGGPNFYPFATDARYELNVDNNGDAKRDITYRWQFTSTYASKDTFLHNTGPVTSLDDKDLNFWQTYRLEEIKWGPDGSQIGTKELAKALPVAPSNVGKASMPDYKKLRDRVIRSKDGVTMFAGQSDDPFFLDLRIFDVLYGGDLSEVGNDTLAPYNVNSVAIQLPKSRVTKGGDPVIGIWSSTSRKNASGQYVQVSRLGMPLVNEVVVPIRDKDKFNASKPADDAQFLKYVTDPEVPKLIEKVYKIKAPKTPRNDLVQAFLTGVPGLNQPQNVTPSEQLRLNTSIPPSADPKRLGVLEGDKAGFPNGRRLADDVVDITLQVAEGELVNAPNDLGDAVDTNNVEFGRTFPYLALPTSGSDVRSGGPASSGSSAPATPQSGQDDTEASPSMLTGGAADPSTSPAANASEAEMTDLVPLGSAIGGAGLLAFGAAWLWRRRRTS